MSIDQDGADMDLLEAEQVCISGKPLIGMPVQS